MIKTIKTKYSDNFSFYSNDNVIGRSLEDKLDSGEGIVEAIVKLNS